jgi:hypothetical protein
MQGNRPTEFLRSGGFGLRQIILAANLGFDPRDTPISQESFQMSSASPLSLPILEPGESVELKGLIPRSVYRRLARKDNGSRARITIRVVGSAGITDVTKIRDLRKA